MDVTKEYLEKIKDKDIKLPNLVNIKRYFSYWKTRQRVLRTEDGKAKKEIIMLKNCDFAIPNQKGDFFIIGRITTPPSEILAASSLYEINSPNLEYNHKTFLLNITNKVYDSQYQYINRMSKDFILYKKLIFEYSNLEGDKNFEVRNDRVKMLIEYYMQMFEKYEVNPYISDLSMLLKIIDEKNWLKIKNNYFVKINNDNLRFMSSIFIKNNESKYTHFYELNYVIFGIARNDISKKTTNMTTGSVKNIEYICQILRCLFSNSEFTQIQIINMLKRVVFRREEVIQFDILNQME